MEVLGRRGRGADVPSGCVGRCGPVPSPKTQTRTTTMPATAWCCTWTLATKCTSSWMEAKHTEATTISTALSLAFFYTPINTQVTPHNWPHHWCTWGCLAISYPHRAAVPAGVHCLRRSL